MHALGNKIETASPEEGVLPLASLGGLKGPTAVSCRGTLRSRPPLGKSGWVRHGAATGFLWDTADGRPP